MSQNLIEGIIVGYESLNGGRVATRFFKTKWGTLSEYIDIQDFPESYKPILREIFNKDIPSDMEKAQEIKSLMYRYPFKVEGGGNLKMSMIEFIRAESKRNWDSSAGIKWCDLSDEQKLELLNLRDNNIIDFVAVQGDYTFWKECGKNVDSVF